MRPNTSLRDEVATQLRNEILRGQYRAGERLPSERDLAERFGVNRGCIREALKTLEQLGLADIRRGGARVQPLGEASLDVLGPLLELEDLPDPELVEQLLEVLEALMGVAVRRAVERASAQQLERMADLLGRAAEAADEVEYQAASHELIELFVEASGNLVLRLVGRGLRLQFMERLHAAGLDARPDRPPFPEEEADGQALRRALEQRDPLAAAHSMQALMRRHRAHVLDVLEERRAANGGAANGDGNGHVAQDGEVPEGRVAAGEGLR